MSWEYKSLIIETTGIMSRGRLDGASIDQKLEEMGRDGWELATAVPVGDGNIGTARLLFTFKRLSADATR